LPPKTSLEFETIRSINKPQTIFPSSSSLRPTSIPKTIDREIQSLVRRTRCGSRGEKFMIGHNNSPCITFSEEKGTQVVVMQIYFVSLPFLFLLLISIVNCFLFAKFSFAAIHFGGWNKSRGVSAVP
jgi:hypothetical protein